MTSSDRDPLSLDRDDQVPTSWTLPSRAGPPSNPPAPSPPPSHRESLYVIRRRLVHPLPVSSPYPLSAHAGPADGIASPSSEALLRRPLLVPHCLLQRTARVGRLVSFEVDVSYQCHLHPFGLMRLAPLVPDVTLIVPHRPYSVSRNPSVPPLPARTHVAAPTASSKAKARQKDPNRDGQIVSGSSRDPLVVVGIFVSVPF